MGAQMTKPVTKNQKCVKGYLVCFLSNGISLMESPNGLCLAFAVQHVHRLSGKWSKH